MQDDDQHEVVRQQAALYNWQKKERDEYIRQQESEHEAFLAEFTHYVSDLDAERALFLKKIIQSIGDVAMQAEMVGIIMGYLVYSKGRTHNGKDPDEELRRMMEEAAKDSTIIDKIEDTKSDMMSQILQNGLGSVTLDDGTTIEADFRQPSDDESPENPYELPDYKVKFNDDSLTMQQYKVRNRFGENGNGENVWTGVECIHCGAMWINLEHRMEDYDCKGCQQIAKWGHKV